MSESSLVSFEASTNSVRLDNATILAGKDDFEGVRIAANCLADDFRKVTGRLSRVIEATPDIVEGGIDAETVIITGTVTKGSLLQQLEQTGKLDLRPLSGKWECFSTTLVDEPFQGCKRALVIAGSDKRGAIYGIYTLSEQIGVSPWYWWADVPTKQHDRIFALSTSTISPEPSVRHRGIFLNDEAPALTGWVLEKFGGYNSRFYVKIFELLLRLKANFLWPAMWPGYPNPGASFFVDDPKNQRLAEAWGIVVSTSHHEPMQRATNEWFTDNPDGSWNWLTNREKINQFFLEGAQRAKGCESYFTLGMRGEYDRKMAAKDPAAVITDVIKAQRTVFKDVYGDESAVPQLLALYKEVQYLYESGRIDVPEHVTLLFQDDNHGTLRQLPTKAQSQRSGGAGIYYHLEYVGWPRSYKWINSVSLGKAWHQLRIAYERNARQIWVFNVGDLKAVEIPLSYAMKLAWNVKDMKSDGLSDFFRFQAERDFGPSLAAQISDVWLGYDRLVSLRKHELIEPDVFSVLNYREADIVLQKWKALLDSAECLHSRMPTEHRSASFELILHPVKASYIFVATQIMRARNRLYARQRRNTANTTAQQVLDLFDADFDLQEEYHNLLNGKWNQMLRQTHFGYGETWHAPSRDMIEGLGYVQRRQNSNPIVGQMGVAVESHEGVRPGLINEESERTHPSRRDLVPGVTLGEMSYYGPSLRWIEVFTRGVPTIHWSATVPFDWIKLSTCSGTLVPGENDVRIHITIDWQSVPINFRETVLIDVRSHEGDFEQIHLPINNRRVPDCYRSGFVECDGCVSMNAPTTIVQPPYVHFKNAGRLNEGSVGLEPTADIGEQTRFLDYHFYNFSQERRCDLVLYFGMTLNLSPEDELTYDLQLDYNTVQSHRLVITTDDGKKRGPGIEQPQADDWMKAAGDMVWIRKHNIAEKSLQAGGHLLRIKLRHPNMLLEKLVVDFGGVKPSYLGPPQSMSLIEGKPS